MVGEYGPLVILLSMITLENRLDDDQLFVRC